MRRIRRLSSDQVGRLVIVVSSLAVSGVSIVLLWMTYGPKAEPVSIANNEGSNEASVSLNDLSEGSVIRPSDPTQIVSDQVLVSEDKKRAIKTKAVEFDPKKTKSTYEARKPAVNSRLFNDGEKKIVKRTEPTLSDGLIGFDRHQASSELSMLSFSSSIDTRTDPSGKRAFEKDFGSAFRPETGPSLEELSTPKTDERHDYAAWAPDLLKGELPEGFGEWYVSNAELLSIARFGEPRIYVGNEFPTIQQLNGLKVRTRSPRSGVVAAVKVLSKWGSKEGIAAVSLDGSATHIGDSVQPCVLSAHPPALIVPISLGDSCLKCHEGEEGQLAGAFVLSLNNKTIKSEEQYRVANWSKRAPMLALAIAESKAKLSKEEQEVVENALEMFPIDTPLGPATPATGLLKK